MWIFYEAIFQKGKESLKKRNQNQTLTNSASFIHKTSSQLHRLLLSTTTSIVRSRNQSLFSSPPSKKKSSFCSLARFFLNFPSFLRFTTGKKRPGKPHDDAQVLSTGRRSESVERGRPMIRMERYSSQTDSRPSWLEFLSLSRVELGRGTGERRNR